MPPRPVPRIVGEAELVPGARHGQRCRKYKRRRRHGDGPRDRRPGTSRAALPRPIAAAGASSSSSRTTTTGSSGVVTEKELETPSPARTRRLTAGEVMLRPEDVADRRSPPRPATRCCSAWKTDSVWHLPVVSDGRLIGVVSKESAAAAPGAQPLPQPRRRRPVLAMPAPRTLASVWAAKTRRIRQPAPRTRRRYRAQRPRRPAPAARPDRGPRAPARATAASPSPAPTARPPPRASSPTARRTPASTRSPTPAART